jgi:hypothetical protein
MSSDRKTKMLLPDTHLACSHKVMILNKPKLLKIIQDIGKEESISRLREAVFDFQRELKDFRSDRKGLFNIGTDGDTIRLNQRYLFNELNQIIETRTLERGRYYLQRLAKAISEYRTNKISDINLNRWKEYSDIITDSLWILDKRDSSGVHRADYWGNFIPQIPNQMIKRYTKKGEWVLDTFVGCGTTLIEAQRLGRNSIGIELQKKVVEIANDAVKSEPNKFNTVNEAIVGDSTKIDYKAVLEKYGQKSAQLLIMHPPYFDIIKFSKDPRDLCNARSIDDFLEKMSQVVGRASKFLDRHRYFALVIGDKYSKGQWIPLGFLTMQEVLKKGFSLKSIIVKNFEETFGKRNQKELWRYRALVGGFYIFKHEYIFLFKKG